jgi:TM2 domain-containing membrane protein YozV
LTQTWVALTIVTLVGSAPWEKGMQQNQPTHSIFLGYVLWIFGFIGAHRFYYGKQITGVIWFFTLGLFFIGWIIDLFLIPSMEREAERRFVAGPISYDLTWILLTFLGFLGIHRFYMGKIFTGLIYLFTGGLFLVGVLYDFLTLNEQLSDINSNY